jgi:hypothetical protein
VAFQPVFFLDFSAFLTPRQTALFCATVVSADISQTSKMFPDSLPSGFEMGARSLRRVGGGREIAPALACRQRRRRRWTGTRGSMRAATMSRPRGVPALSIGTIGRAARLDSCDLPRRPGRSGSGGRRPPACSYPPRRCTRPVPKRLLYGYEAPRRAKRPRMMPHGGAVPCQVARALRSRALEALVLVGELVFGSARGVCSNRTSFHTH